MNGAEIYGDFCAYREASRNLKGEWSWDGDWQADRIHGHPFLRFRSFASGTLAHDFTLEAGQPIVNGGPSFRIMVEGFIDEQRLVVIDRYVVADFGNDGEFPFQMGGISDSLIEFLDCTGFAKSEVDVWIVQRTKYSAETALYGRPESPQRSAESPCPTSTNSLAVP